MSWAPRPLALATAASLAIAVGLVTLSAPPVSFAQRGAPSEKADEARPTAAPDLTRWEPFGLAEGLPETSVLSIHQDSLGFLWIATQGGLARYDGAEMTVFAPDADDPRALPGRTVIGRMIDAPGGDLWVGVESGLARYDRASGDFVPFPVDLPPPPVSAPTHAMMPVGADARGHVWALDYYNNVYRFDPALAETDPDAALTRYDHDPNDPATLSAGTASRIPGWSFPITSETFVSDAVLTGAGGVWVGTVAGLNRYDPATDGWVRYRHDPADAGSLSSDVVHTLTEGDDGSVWVSTDRGLNRLDPATGRVTVYRHDPGDARTLSADLVIAAHPDREGAVWVSTAAGLDRLDPATGLVTRVAQGPDANTFAAEAQPDEIAGWLIPTAETETGVWFQSYGGAVVHYDRPTGAVTVLGPESVGDRAFSIAADRSGTVWVGTLGRGLHKLDRTPQAAVLRHDPGDAGTLSSDDVRAVYEPPSTPGVLWIGTAEGLDRLDRATGRVTRFASRPGDAASLTPGAVLAVHEDAAGRLWVGTDGGLSLFDRATGRVTRTQRDPADPATLLSDRVRAITSTPDGAVWLGIDNSEAGGVVRLDPGTGALTSYGAVAVAYAPGLYRQVRALPASRRLAAPIQPGAEAGAWREAFTLADSAHVLVLGMGEWEGPQEPRDVAWLEDASGRTVWEMEPVIRTVGAGGWTGNRVRASVLHLGPGAYTVRFRATATHGSGSWTKFAAPDHPDLWGAHVWRLTPTEARTFAGLLDRRDENRIRGLESRGLTLGDGRVWVASDDGGVAGLDPETGRVTVHYSEADGPASGQGLVWADGSLWVADYTHGLLRLDPETGRARRVLDESGAPFAGVSGAITQDRSGRVWLATQTGLTRVDPETDAVRRFGAEYGVPPITAASGAARASDGTVFFATDRGLLSVEPSAFAAAAEPPDVALTGFEIAGEPVEPGPGAPLAADITVAERVVLSYGEDDFTIRYAPLRFDRPGAYATRYRLTGFDEGWIQAGTERRVRYTSLSPGRYTFEVQAANADGVWPETGRQLEVVVRPPWWRSGWAALVYLLAAVGLGAVVARERRRRERLRYQAERERLEAEQLRALDATKSEFFANVSHEFRTPLTLTLGPLDDLLAGLHGPLGQAQSGQVALARRNAGRVLGLINQMLEVARLEAGRTRLRARPVDLGAFVGDLARRYAAQAEREGLTLEVDGPEAPVEVVADPAQLETALGNVLANAVKFTPEGGEVRVTVETDAPGAEGASARVAVRDTGPGIPTEDLPHVFDRFHQVRSTTLAQLGTGIGLALAREIMGLHGGTITVESSTGEGSRPRGSTFTLALPLGRGHLAPDQVDEGLGPWSAAAEYDGDRPADVGTNGSLAPADLGDKADDEDRTTILVVEDHPDVRAFVRRHLEAPGLGGQPGYRVVEAADGLAGLAAARERLPDLVVSDVMMPGLDGLGLVRALRADPATDFLPVVLLTAKAAPEDRLEGLAELADAYLTKPFDPAELRAQVDALLAVRQRLRERFRLEGVALALGEHNAPVAEAPPAIPSADDVFAAEVRETVEARLGDPAFGVEALAEALGQSRSTLHRRAKATLGATPSETIRAARLARGAALLAAQAGTVGEVAYAVGFKSVGHFSDSFVRAYGVRPSEYAARG